jgi:hypothetical protein
MKTVLLHVYGDDGQKARLDAAVALVRAFDGRLQCIQVTALSSYVVTEPFGGMYMVGQLYETLERQAREEKAKIDLQLKDSGVPHEWIGFDGGVAQSIVSGRGCPISSCSASRTMANVTAITRFRSSPMWR